MCIWVCMCVNVVFNSMQVCSCMCVNVYVLGTQEMLTLAWVSYLAVYSGGENSMLIRHLSCAVLACSVMSDSWDPMDCSLPGSSTMGTLQARILECVAMPSSRGSSQPWDRTQVSHIVDGFFTVWATREAPSSTYSLLTPSDSSSNFCRLLYLFRIQ